MVAPFRRGAALPENGLEFGSPPDYSFSFSVGQANNLL
jgi:hypothetical protein